MCMALFEVAAVAVPARAAAAALPGWKCGGRALQVDPIKLKLKVTATERLKLPCHVLLSKFAFNFNKRRYT